jgi:ubiquinone/menaquinone biosynthesis C-methylase UbiE
MSTKYDPKTYFTKRCERQGSQYVTRHGATPEFFQQQMKDFASHLPNLPADVRVLDYGCGVGRLLDQLAGFDEYAGVDIVEKAIEIAHTAHDMEHYGGRARFYALGDDGRIPFDDNHFNLSCAITVFQHIPEDLVLDVLDEFKRVSLGRVMIIDTNEDSTAAHMFKRPPAFYTDLLGLSRPEHKIIDVDHPGSHYVLHGEIK